MISDKIFNVKKKEENHMDYSFSSFNGSIYVTFGR